MIEILEGFWIDPESVKAIKRISEDSCALWLTGQDATTGGFVLDCSAEDLLAALGHDEEEEYDDDAE